MDQELDYQELTGTVETVIFKNEENGYTILKLRDDSGEIVMPSRGSFEAARLDALVLTHPVLSALASGGITIEKAIADLEQMRDKLSEDSLDSPFDNLRFGDADYMQAGDSEPLRMLLDAAIEKLQEAAER